MNVDAADGDSVREFEWEANGWHLNELPSTPRNYSLWRDGEVLYLAGVSDLIESIQIESRAELDELVTRLLRARDDVFPA